MIDNQKKVKIIGKTVLILAIVVVFGITYAVFTQTLQINGEAAVLTSNWDVHFANLRPVDGQGNVTGSITGTAQQLTAPVIKSGSGTVSLTGTSIGDYVVSLVTPGDKISYIFDVVNDGDYNVGISSAGSIDQNGNIVTPICKVGDDATAPSAVNVCNHLKYTLNYYNTATGQATSSVGSYTPNSSDVNVFNEFDPNGIAAHSSVTMILTLEFFENPSDGAETQLPTQTVNISGLGFNIVYNQIGNAINGQ